VEDFKWADSIHFKETLFIPGTNKCKDEG